MLLQIEANPVKNASSLFSFSGRSELETGLLGIHLTEVSVFARMAGKNRHFCDLS